MRIITLSKHSSEWHKLFQTEVELIKLVLSKNYIASYHIGSTAISGIRSKPVIDILVEVKSIIEIIENNMQFKALGYEAKGEYGIPGRRFFQKGKERPTHHIHIFKSGNSEIERHRLFVEYLNAHPNKAAHYENLKIELSAKFANQPQQYSQGKSKFIDIVDIEAKKWKKQLTTQINPVK